MPKAGVCAELSSGRSPTANSTDWNSTEQPDADPPSEFSESRGRNVAQIHSGKVDSWFDSLLTYLY